MKWKAPAIVLLVFALGVALGVVSMRLVQAQSNNKGRAELLNKMTRELDLSAEQQKQLEGILEETRGKFRNIYEQIRPQMDQTRQEGRDKIRTFLTADQKDRFESMLRRMDEERKARESR